MSDDEPTTYDVSGFSDVEKATLMVECMLALSADHIVSAMVNNVDDPVLVDIADGLEQYLSENDPSDDC